MIRRQFMKFAPKEKSEEKNRKQLQKTNVPVYDGPLPTKFNAFSGLAQEIKNKRGKEFGSTAREGKQQSADKVYKRQQDVIYGGHIGPTGDNADPSNPYARAAPVQGNPYADTTSYGSSNPYGDVQGGASNPYSSMTPAADPYAGSGGRSTGSMPSGKAPSVRMSPQSSDATYGDDLGVYNYEAASQKGSDNTKGTDSTYTPGPSSGSTSASSRYGGYERPPANAYSTAPQPRYQQPSPQQGASGYGAPQAYGRAPSLAPADEYEGIGEPLRRTYTSQSQQQSRDELFGAAPIRANPPNSELDELNAMPDDPEEGQVDELDELNRASLDEDAPTPLTRQTTRDSLLSVSSASRIPGRSGSAAAYGGGTAYDSVSQQPAIQEEPEDPEDELNELPMRANGYSQQQQQLEDSDDDVEEIKREIRFTKKESVQSTRNALRLAAEAETSGRNTLGMLGWQGEKLANTEANLNLTDTQTKIGAENARELKRLNRSIFMPNMSNRFNSRRRNQEKEARLRSEHAQDMAARERRAELQEASEQRITEGLNSSTHGYSETANRVRRDMMRNSAERRARQFEADSEDEEMEDEIDDNLDALGDHSKRLHNLSLALGDEVDDQNKRIERLGRDVDRVDVDIHMNTTRMATIH